MSPATDAPSRAGQDREERATRMPPRTSASAVTLSHSPPWSAWAAQWVSAAIGSTPPSTTAPTAKADAYQPLCRCTPQLNSATSSR